MITMSELMDLRLQQHIVAQEIYRQQIMQRIPDPFHHMLPMSHHVIMPPRSNLPGVKAKLENDELWQQFHQIGTEMIITKTGRRIFPSMRLSLSGLEDESNYCVLLEMVPIGDCRYKFSGSQWVPAGGAEPQSPQRMYLHPDSPATGAHWQNQPLLFNKVKLTNNTLDNNGHMVLASMHKYQPRLHVIRTSDLTQLPWAPQQAFVFPETEFVAVTAYQNDRITKLKIDNNPFAKGFRESGQSRCKRKLSTSPSLDDQQLRHQQQQPSHALSDDDRNSLSSYDSPQIKRMRSNDSACSSTSPFDEGSVRNFENVSPPKIISDSQQAPNLYMRSMAAENSLIGRAALADLAYMYFPRPQPMYPADYRTAFQPYDFAVHLPVEQQIFLEKQTQAFEDYASRSATPNNLQSSETFVDVESTSSSEQTSVDDKLASGTAVELPLVTTNQHSFSISAILGNRNILSI